jgi:hypothetical protein
MEPEVIDPREQAIYDDYERKRKDYADFAAAAPVQEKPGLWRTLAAIGAGAFGGSQYDKGGMQWGQNLAKEITEGPYQRKMNEHLKMLAAKRMGLDVAQEGMGVMGQNADRKQRIALAAQTAADRKAQAEAALDQKRQYANDVWKKNIDHNTKGNWKSFQSPEELAAFQQANPKFQGWEVRKSSVALPNGAQEILLVEPESERQQRSAIDVSSTINMYNQIAPKVGMQPIDNPGKVSKEEATFKLNEAKELYKMKYQADANNLGYARIAAMMNRGGGDDDKAAKAEEKRKFQETAKINAQFAALKAQKENYYQREIARAMANGNKEEANRLATQRGEELVEALNNAALQTANIWGHEKFKQYRMGPKGVEEFMVGKGAEAAPTKAPAATPKSSDPLGVL